MNKIHHEGVTGKKAAAQVLKKIYYVFFKKNILSYIIY